MRMICKITIDMESLSDADLDKCLRDLDAEKIRRTRSYLNITSKMTEEQKQEIECELSRVDRIKMLKSFFPDLSIRDALGVVMTIKYFTQR